MTDNIDHVMAEFQHQFLDRARKLVSKIRQDIDRLDGEEDAISELIFAVHKIHGSAGTFGFTLLSRLAGDLELLLDDANRDGARLHQLADALATVIEAGGNLSPEAETRLLEGLTGTRMTTP